VCESSLFDAQVAGEQRSAKIAINFPNSNTRPTSTEPQFFSLQ
jgi:hypothetical protein